MDEPEAMHGPRFGGVPASRWALALGSALVIAGIIAALVVVLTGGPHGSGHASANGDSGSSPAATATEEASASRGAQAWAGFAVDANPRPIVLLGEDTEGPDKGFATGDAKLAFLSGQLRWDIDVPSGQRTMNGYPLMTATEAAERLRPAGSKKPDTSVVLAITSATLSSAEFQTDRGLRALPAWRFGLTDANSYVYVLAIGLSARAQVPDETLSYGSLRAAASADGRNITIRFVARHDSTDPCDPPYTSSLEVVQTRTAVALAITMHPLPVRSSTGEIACGLVGSVDTAPVTEGAPNTRTIELDEPLGARVVVDGNGSPYQVTT